MNDDYTLEAGYVRINPMIISSQNARIQYVRALLSKPRHRTENQAYVLEGIRLSEEALAFDIPVELVLYTAEVSNRGKKLIRDFADKGVVVEEVTPEVMDSLSKTETSQGLLVVAPIPQKPLPSSLQFILIADTIRDPGNMGTILRSAAAAGVQGIILTPGTVDCYSPKVIRSAMGAHFHLPVASLDWPEIHHLLKEEPNPLQILLADVHQGRSCWQTDLRQPTALLIGSEAEGASPAAHQLADALIHIPMPGGFESLNASVAAAILLFEVVRQRNKS